MRDPKYYVAQAAHCRNLSLRTSDRSTAFRLDELAREYEALVSDLTRSEAPMMAPALAPDAPAKPR
jgi:hypothetical protein